ncbi:MAG: integrase family protein [Lentisphaerae bacterium]|nr:integrase family protein [Lentisphaerota bacterium]MCP4100015.1 integrase family protein [Lentisphaerota bacterium]
MNKIKFTKSSLEKLPTPDKKTTYQDVNARYLHFVITPKNTRTYYYIRNIKGRPKYIKIASYSDVSIKAAQERVSQINTDVMCGVDTKQKGKDNITLEEAFKYWLKHREQIRGWHKDIKECWRRFESYVPSRLLQSIRTSINLLIKHEHNIPQNPAAMIDMFKERSRARYIKEDEVESFFTDKRKSNVLAAEWSEIDFNKRLWTIPGEKTKNDDDDVTVLDDTVLEILTRRQKEQKERGIKTNWVFYSSKSKKGYYSDPTPSWRVFLKRANIKDLRIHDLRRTLASWMANQNVSLHMIASVLGQKSTGVTPTYARLSVDPKRETVSNAVAEMLKAGKLKLGDNDLELDKMRQRIQKVAEQLAERPGLIDGVEGYIKVYP